MKKILLITLFTTVNFLFIQSLLFSKGCYDGLKDVTINIHLLDQQTQLPISNAQIIMEVLPASNLMTPPAGYQQVALTEVENGKGVYSVVGKFAFANCFKPIEQPQLGSLNEFLILNAKLSVACDGYQPQAGYIIDYKREPILFENAGEYKKHTALYPPGTSEVEVYLDLVPQR